MRMTMQMRMRMTMTIRMTNDNLILILILIFFIAMIIVTIHIIIMETIFMNTGNSKTNEPHRFRLDLADKLNLKNPKKNIALVNLSTYYTW